MTRAWTAGLGATTLAIVTIAAARLAVDANSSAPSADPAIVLERVPNGGIQPQAVADGRGGVHVVYFRGDAASGDIYYVHRSADATYSAPVRINSQSRSAIATGTVRGAQVAVGRDGMLHVVWNGSTSSVPKIAGGLPLFYTRGTGQTFAPQANLLTTNAVDGGGTVAADAGGRVFVAWHAVPTGGREATGTVFLRRSTDDGMTFDKERRVSDPILGACGCCSMRGAIDREGGLRLLFRAAGRDVDRDTTMLVSRDLGETFSATRLHPWRIGACPMSTFALAETSKTMVTAWDTDGRVFVQRGTDTPVTVPHTTAPAKHPVLVANDRGELLAAWLEGTGWSRGGAVAWQRYDGAGRAIGQAGSAAGVPAWGLAAAAPLADGRFLLLY
jgi:hypothetical protein